MQRADPVIGVFANQRWQSDYMAGPGNKKPRRNLGVTLQHMSPGVGLDVCTSTCTWDNHVKVEEDWKESVFSLVY